MLGSPYDYGELYDLYPVMVAVVHSVSGSKMTAGVLFFTLSSLNFISAALGRKPLQFHSKSHGDGSYYGTI